LCRYNFIQVNTICKTQLNFDSVFFMYLITLSMVLYFFTIWENGLHALPCYLMLFFFLFFFPSYIFVLSCRSSLVNHTDLERLFCLEDFLTWDHGQLIWFVAVHFCMYFFKEMIVTYSLWNLQPLALHCFRLYLLESSLMYSNCFKQVRWSCVKFLCSYGQKFSLLTRYVRFGII